MNGNHIEFISYTYSESVDVITTTSFTTYTSQSGMSRKILNRKNYKNVFKINHDWNDGHTLYFYIKNGNVVFELPFTLVYENYQTVFPNIANIPRGFTLN